MSSSASNGVTPRARRADDESTTPPFGLMVLAWLVPGATHVALGQTRKGVIFLVVLVGMFAIGCGFGGRLFPFQTSEWLVFLAAVAQWGLGLPRMVGALVGAGAGEVTSVTYEYGNTFLMTAGLLNALVVLNAYDLTRERRNR